MSTAIRDIPRSVRWTVGEYDRLTRQGYFNRRRVELINGRIVRMPPKLEPHVVSVSLCAKAVARAFGEGYFVRQEAPLRQGSRSKPEPDVAVVPGNARDYLTRGTPDKALLVIEVAEKSLRYDRGRKASLYAEHGIVDYWIVNLVDRTVEVHRQPMPDPSYRYRFRYNEIRVLRAADSIAPIAAPGQFISAAELLPW